MLDYQRVGFHDVVSDTQGLKDLSPYSLHQKPTPSCTDGGLALLSILLLNTFLFFFQVNYLPAFHIGVSDEGFFTKKLCDDGCDLDLYYLEGRLVSEAITEELEHL